MGGALKERYVSALNSFVEKVKQDKYVLAVILAGSLYHDVVWEKSDIDVILIVDDLKEPEQHFSLTEDGILINASTFDRRKFKRRLDAGFQGGFFHSWISRSTLLYTRDETFRELYESLSELGDGDKALLLLGHGCSAVGDLAKAQKWLLVKNDVMYSYYWLMRSLNNLATIEVIMHDHIPGREVILQALELNAPFFRNLYVDLAQIPKSEAVMKQALSQVESYLKERTLVLFAPVLELLAEHGTTMGLSELDEHFTRLFGLAAVLVEACEWLADQGVIEKLSSPVELTRKSRAFVDEVAYYYDGGKTR